MLPKDRRDSHYRNMLPIAYFYKYLVCAKNVSSKLFALMQHAVVKWNAQTIQSQNLDSKSKNVNIFMNKIF